MKCCLHKTIKNNSIISKNINIITITIIKPLRPIQSEIKRDYLLHYANRQFLSQEKKKQVDTPHCACAITSSQLLINYVIDYVDDKTVIMV